MTKNYEAIQKALFSLAESRCELEGRRASVVSTYKVVYDANVQKNIDYEITADLAAILICSSSVPPLNVIL